LRAGRRLRVTASASRQNSIEFAAIAMSPCVFELKRPLNARSADAVQGAASGAPSASPQKNLRTGAFVDCSAKGPQCSGRHAHSIRAHAPRSAGQAQARLSALTTTGGTTMATRTGSAEWQGDLQDGGGTLTVGDGVFEGAYSFASRFEEGEGTNPEELIAAAHASCFAMALSNILAENGHSPTSVRASARVGLRNVDGAPTIDRIALDVTGDVPGLDADAFRDFAQQAKEGCPVSRALAGVPKIDLDARLA